MEKFKPTKKQLNLFNKYFNQQDFERIRDAVQKVINETESYWDLRFKLSKSDVLTQFTEEDDFDFEYTNSDFIPDYDSDDDSCDFLAPICWADLKYDDTKTFPGYVGVRLLLIWNDEWKGGWIDAVSLDVGPNDQEIQSICLFNPRTYEIMLWCAD
jgi:hypothetical protein